jgi:hypothetical protein
MRDKAAAVIVRFDAMAATPQDPDTLLNMAVGNPSIPSTYLCCASLHANAKHRVYIVHVLSKYIPVIDGQVTPWDNRICGFLGEVLGDQALNIAIPATAFNAVQCTVYNEARLGLELPNLNDGDLFSRVTAANQDVEVLQSRHLMYLPTKLPDFWFTLATTTKKQEFSIVRKALDAFSRTEQAYINTAYIPTPKLVTDLLTITFTSDHPDDLKTGIQPFLVMDGSKEYRLATQDLACNYTLLSERDFGLNYTDLDHFN